MKACIDIGGTKVAVSLNSGAGLELMARRSEPTAKTGHNDALARQVMRTSPAPKPASPRNLSIAPACRHAAPS